MKIDPSLQGTKAPDLNKQSKTEPAKEAAATKDQVAGKLKTDTVVISEEARTLQRTESELKAHLDQMETASTVRRDKVELAMAKIAGGQFIIDDVVDGTAEAILKSGALSDIINSDKLAQARLSGMKSLQASPEKLAAIKERIESGYYNTPEMAGKIADSIMDELLA
ncbi:MAG TPA: flagellar biosynthesis anti-sigma factor FlgM [archaeon]|nr:flagellar biosynthesis anti-sigma factor FlgM [archaeon]